MRIESDHGTMAKHKKRKLNPHHQGKPPSQPQEAPKKTPPKNQTKPTIPFNPEDRILLIGEGDFSFATSIVEHHGCCDVTATSFDSKVELLEKYHPQGERHIQHLEDEGQTVLYSVDATKLDSNKTLTKAAVFDAIIFNFPHIGGKTKDVNRQVRFNQELLVKFFSAATHLLSPNGTIVVTLFEGEPYTLWNIRDLARHAGLEVQRSFKFLAEAYPSYRHSRTLGNVEGGGGWKGEDRDARSFVFRRKGGQDSGKKRRREVESEDEDD